MSDPKHRLGLTPMRPGELLRQDVVPALKAAGTTCARVAELLGVGRRTLYGLLDGKVPVNAVMALKLGKMLGNSPGFWMTLQANYDLALARARLGDTLESIPNLTPTVE